MRRFSLLAALLLAGCAPRPPLEEPTIKSVPAALISDSGASLYVLEAWQDLLDDDSKIAWEIPGIKDTWRTSEQCLGLLLRHALSHKSVILVGHADFQPWSGFPTEVTLFNPDSEAHGPRPNPRRVGFRIRLMAVTGADPKQIDMEWEAEQVTESPYPNEAGGRPGEYPRTVEKIAKGTATMPIGMALIMRQPKGGGREYILILRVASLEDP